MNPYALFRGAPYALFRGAPYALFRGAPYALFRGLDPYALFRGLDPYALKGQKLLAQGNAPGYDIEMVITPCKGKSFPTAAIYFNAFALTGRRAITQTLPRALPWARSFCPFRACREHLMPVYFRACREHLMPVYFRACREHMGPVQFSSGGNHWFRA